MKKKSRLVLSILVLCFIMGLVLISGAEASQDTRVCIDPSSIFDPALIPGTQFSVDLVVEDVQGLWGYQFEMSFNPDVLQGVEVQVGPFLGSAGGTFLELAGQGFGNEAGKLYLTGATLMQTDPAYCPSGRGILATVTFEVVGYGGSSLRLGPHTGLLDYDSNWILQGLEHVESGYFANQETHDVEIASITSYPDEACPGDPVFITVVVDNEGTFTESFSVTVFAIRWGTDERYSIDEQAIEELASGASVTLSVVWDTTDFPCGTYEVYAEASAVPGETGKTENNIANTTFGGIGVEYPKPTWIDLFIRWATMAIKVAPVAAVAVVTVVIFKSLMSVKTRWPIRWR